MMKWNKKHVQETQERVCNTQKYKMKRKREKKKMNVIDTKDCMSKAKKKNGSWPNE